MATPTNRGGAAARRGAGTARLRASVSRTLQAYADRGLFRGFAAAATARGAERYQFLWLTRRPVVVVLDPARRRLVFQHLFPNATGYAGVAEAIRRTVASASSAERPPHRRLEPRRAKMTCRFAGGQGSLHLAIAGTDGASAVRAALGFVNEIFLVLHECFPEYLITEFGASPE